MPWPYKTPDQDEEPAGPDNTFMRHGWIHFVGTDYWCCRYCQSKRIYLGPEMPPPDPCPNPPNYATYLSIANDGLSWA